MKKLNAILSLFLAASIFAACTTGTKKGESTAKEEVKKPTLKVYAFTVGDILVKDISLFNPGVDTGQTKKFTNSAYLIRHEKGDLIWDSGLPDKLASIPEGNDGAAFLMKMPKTLSSQLAEINVTADEIEYFAISHMHGDHTGNANMFKASTLLFQQEEYAAIFEGDAIDPNFVSLEDNKAIKLNGDHDVFGDGSVIIKRAPGHTPGHQVLFLDLPEYGPVVLSGDLYHFTKNRELRGVPAFNTDKDQTLKSMDAIEAFILEKNAKLLIQHDFEQNQTIPHAPDFIK